jgi:phosphatidate cytidylyltransferase
LAAWLVSPGADLSAARASGPEFDDLGARILSALVLGSAAIAAALAGGPWIAGAAGAAVVAMAYEWARMSEPRALSAAFAMTLAGALGGVMLASRGLPGWALGWLAAWALLSAARRRSWVGAIESAFGVLYIGAPAVAFLWLRGQPGWGLEGALTLFGVIWSADSAAYFGGRILGGPKLMPRTSPQKTWSGLAAGTAAGAAAGAICANLFDGPMFLWLGVGACLAALGLGGDLFESALKRRFGVKDASRLIPGHGGVLDRIDGLMAAVTVFSLAAHLAPSLRLELFG